MDGSQPVATERPLASQAPLLAPRPPRSRKRLLLAAAALALLGGGGYFGYGWWTTGRFLEETDDAVQAAGGTATLLPLDLADGAALDSVGPSLAARFGRLDALAHCAADLGKLTPVSHIQERDWAGVAAVNLAATWRLIRTCAPLLQAADAGRAVFVTDAVTAAPRAYWGLYGATKAAQIALARSWQAEAEKIGPRVTVDSPAPMPTATRARFYPGENRDGLTPCRDEAARIVAALLD